MPALTSSEGVLEHVTYNFKPLLQHRMQCLSQVQRIHTYAVAHQAEVTTGLWSPPIATLLHGLTTGLTLPYLK